jgi:hypothetical protein
MRLNVNRSLTQRSLGPLTQEVEYLPFKQRVVGSSPARPTKRGA